MFVPCIPPGHDTRVDETATARHGFGPMPKPKAQEPPPEPDDTRAAAVTQGGSATPRTAETYVDIRLAQAGDAVALNRLFERYYNRVRTVARSRLGPNLA